MDKLFFTLFLTSATFALLTACPKPEPVTPIPADVFESGLPSDSEDPPPGRALFPECARACATLVKLGCPEGTRPDGGKTCYAVCADSQRNPGMSPLQPSCVGNAVDVSGVRACGTVRCAK